MEQLFPKHDGGAQLWTTAPPSSWAWGDGTGGTCLVATARAPSRCEPMLKQGELYYQNCQSYKSLLHISTSINKASRKPRCNSGVLPATFCDTLTPRIAIIRIKAIILTTPRNPRVIPLLCQGAAVNSAEPLFWS